MARQENLPWNRGTTYYNGGTIDSTNLGGVNYEGKEYMIEDLYHATGMYVTLRIVRNSGTFNLLPGKLASFDTSYVGQRCNGHTDVSNAPGVPIDEALPAAGVVPNDLFYVVMEGPALLVTPLDGAADNVINIMDPVVAITAATSGATTAGRIATAGTSGATTMTRDGVLNVIGRAMSAMTTANTNASVLVNATRWF